MAVNQFPPGLDIGNEHHPLSGVFNILKRMVHTDAYVAWDAFRAGYNMHTVRAWDVEEVPESRVPPYFAATSIRSLQGLHGNTRVGGGDAFPLTLTGRVYNLLYSLGPRHLLVDTSVQHQLKTNLGSRPVRVQRSHALP